MSKRANLGPLQHGVPSKRNKRRSFLTSTQSIPRGGYQSGRELARPGQELKAFDNIPHILPFTVATGAPTFIALNTMINGAELFQRIGRKIYMKNIHIRGWIQPTGPTNASGDDMLRIIVFYDAQCNATNPAIADLLQEANVGGGTTGFSEINLTNRARFMILRDYQMQVGAISLNTGSINGILGYPDEKGSLSVDMFIKMKGLQAEYNGVNGGTVGDISSGAVFITAISCNGAHWQFNFGSRVRYFD